MFIYKISALTNKDLVNELKLLQTDPRGISIMANKLSSLSVKITDLPGYCALIIKESALSAGAEFCLPRAAIKEPNTVCDGILLATVHQTKAIIQKLQRQPFKEIKFLLTALKKILIQEKIKTPKIMGILNVTPDSFSDGGKYISTEKAVVRAVQMIKQGASIIDIGGESSRPGAEEISLAEELERTIPVIKALRKINKKITISIDTTKSKVAEEALKNGANIINDISGLNHDKKIADVAAKYSSKLILMHRLAPSKTMQNNPEYHDIIKEILLSLRKSIETALNAGVKKENIIIDPGIGFGKTTEHNLYLIKNIQAFKALGLPILLGASRKSVIGNTLQNRPAERLAGTIATSIMGQLNNIDYLRVHDVAENRDAIKMFSALLWS